MRSVAICLFLLCFFIFSIPMYLIECIIGLFSKTAKVKSSQWIVCKLGFAGLRFFSGAKVTVIGLENVPQDEPVLYVANHRSYFDIVIGYMLAKNNTGFVAKKSMEKLPFFNVWMKYINCQFLDRDDIKAGLKVILRCIELIREGTSIWIFPEGTRSSGDEMLPFKEGSFKIATKTGCKIVPVAINNTDEIFENHFPWVHKQKVVFEFGKPIDVSKMDRESTKHLGVQVQGVIAEMIKKNHALYFPETV